MTFVPYVGEGNMHSRNVLNQVRKLMDEADEMQARGEYTTAHAAMTSAHFITLDYIANMGHHDINTAQRLAIICGGDRK